jgi:4-hydroxy-3-methylbut-2-enyl diphosphate reductase
MQVILANPRGFCAGVDRAIDIVERALDIFGAPVFVRHEVVHNRRVVSRLRDEGAIFVESLEEIPDDSVVIFSAHGVPQSVRRAAKERGLNVFDATCPLVTKVHMEVKGHRKRAVDCILIGHAGHPEVEGTLGQADSGMHLVESVEDVARLSITDPNHLAYVTQTTLSVDDTRAIIDALRERYPNIQGPRKDDICYATQNRQDAVKTLADQCGVVLVVGSPNSSNSNRLREIAEQTGVHAYLIDEAADIDPAWLDGVTRVGVTAGASAPEDLVQQVVGHLQTLPGSQDAAGGSVVEIQSAPENVSFSLPVALRKN